MTRRLWVRAETSTRTREIDLRRGDDGRWTVPMGRSLRSGSVSAHQHHAGAPARAPSGAGKRDFLMAWVLVPDLMVRPTRQTFTHLARTERGARVRYAAADFRSEVEFDGTGSSSTTRGWPAVCPPRGESAPPVLCSESAVTLSCGESAAVHRRAVNRPVPLARVRPTVPTGHAARVVPPVTPRPPTDHVVCSAATIVIRRTRRAGRTAADRPISTVSASTPSTGRTGGPPTVPTAEVTDRAAVQP